MWDKNHKKIIKVRKVKYIMPGANPKLAIIGFEAENTFFHCEKDLV
jgi:hypothetical protein